MKSWLPQLLIALTAVCLSLKDVKDAECDVACRREGANAGYYVEKPDKCACVNFYDYKRVTRKVPQLTRVPDTGTDEQEVPIYLRPGE